MQKRAECNKKVNSECESGVQGKKEIQILNEKNPGDEQFSKSNRSSVESITKEQSRLKDRE